MGAAGAVEAAATVLALRHGQVPPTMGLEESDPELDLSYTPLWAAEKSITTAMTTSYGMGGCNAAGCFRRADESQATKRSAYMQIFSNLMLFGIGQGVTSVLKLKGQNANK
jgi:acyl transferase domain-containing protein